MNNIFKPSRAIFNAPGETPKPVILGQEKNDAPDPLGSATPEQREVFQNERREAAKKLATNLEAQKIARLEEQMEENSADGPLALMLNEQGYAVNQPDKVKAVDSGKDISLAEADLFCVPIVDLEKHLPHLGFNLEGLPEGQHASVDEAGTVRYVASVFKDSEGNRKFQLFVNTPLGEKAKRDDVVFDTEKV